MSNYFEYLTEIPNIPDELLSEVYKSIHEHENVFVHNFYSNYQIFNLTDELIQFIKLKFNNHIIQVHVIKNVLAIHKDINRTIAFNYLIDCGGNNVETCFYDKKLKLIEKIKIEPFKWHKLDVSTFHNVINLERPRIALTITPQ
jgi:hypothetical protein